MTVKTKNKFKRAGKAQKFRMLHLYLSLILRGIVVHTPIPSDRRIRCASPLGRLPRSVGAAPELVPLRSAEIYVRSVLGEMVMACPWAE